MKKIDKKPKTPKSIEDFSLRELGSIFKRERERRRITQGEIAKRIEKSKTAVVYYENGSRPIHWGTFIKLCSAIRVSPSYIIDKWMNKDSFDVLDEQRRKEYHTVIDEMIKYGFSTELDNLLVYFRGLINREKEIREKLRQKKMIGEFFREKEGHGGEGV